MCTKLRVNIVYEQLKYKKFIKEKYLPKFIETNIKYKITLMLYVNEKPKIINTNQLLQFILYLEKKKYKIFILLRKAK